MDRATFNSIDWVAVLGYENLPGAPRPQAALRGWLRDRGIDWMPLGGDDVRIDLACGPDATGRWHGHFGIAVAAPALRRLGLHPDQPTSRVTGPSPPAWWHAEAERAWRR